MHMIEFAKGKELLIYGDVVEVIQKLYEMERDKYRIKHIIIQDMPTVDYIIFVLERVGDGGCEEG